MGEGILSPSDIRLFFFEINIDPGDTDVSIYYEVICRTDMITNTQIHLDRIENVNKVFNLLSFFILNES